MTFKEQFLKELREDTAFRDEVTFILAESLTDVLSIDTEKQRVELPEYSSDLVEEVYFSNINIPSDEKRIESLSYEAKQLINGSFNKIWGECLSRQQSKPTESRKLFSIKMFELITDKTPISYIDSVRSLLCAVEVDLIFKFKNEKLETKFIDYIQEYYNNGEE
jgi:hypothetical protein